MKFYKPDNLTVIKALLLFTFLALIGCGIPSYPYLYPPEALGGGRVGFNHDANNNPDVFRGYEIFYRFYADPESTGISQAEIDMQNYFTGDGAIRSIIYGTSSSALTYGFRRLIIEGNKDTDPSPQLPIDIADRNNTFTIELIEDETNEVIRFTYDSVTYNVFRYVPYTESVEYDYKPFLPANDESVYDFTNGESDINDSEDLNETKIFVAFFAVPYGIDPVSQIPLYANGSYEGMEYIGSFDLSSL